MGEFSPIAQLILALWKIVTFYSLLVNKPMRVSMGARNEKNDMSYCRDIVRI